jgi:hypothetical protein
MPVFVTTPTATSNTACPCGGVDAGAVSVSPRQCVGRIKTTAVHLVGAGDLEYGGELEVNGVTGGNGTVGTISRAGLYKAPNSVPRTSTVRISATSARPTKSATASVTVTRR